VFVRAFDLAARGIGQKGRAGQRAILRRLVDCPEQTALEGDVDAHNSRV